MPPEFQKWIPVVLGWFCTSIGISFAWFVQRMLSAFISSVRGGLQCSRSLLAFAAKRGITAGGLLKANHEDTVVDEVLVRFNTGEMSRLFYSFYSFYRFILGRFCFGWTLFWTLLGCLNQGCGYHYQPSFYSVARVLEPGMWQPLPTLFLFRC